MFCCSPLHAKAGGRVVEVQFILCSVIGCIYPATSDWQQQQQGFYVYDQQFFAKPRGVLLSEWGNPFSCSQSSPIVCDVRLPIFIPTATTEIVAPKERRRRDAEGGGRGDGRMLIYIIQYACCMSYSQTINGLTLLLPSAACTTVASGALAERGQRAGRCMRSGA